MSRKFSVHGETEHVEPKFPRDDNHIRHSLLMVATPKSHMSLDDRGKLSFGGRQTMSLKKGTNGHLHTVNVLYAQTRDRLHAERRTATEPS